MTCRSCGRIVEGPRTRYCYACRCERRRGERNGNAKLTADAVLAIRRELGSQVAVGRKYGISPSQVGAIRLRQEWRHI